MCVQYEKSTPAHETGKKLILPGNHRNDKQSKFFELNFTESDDNSRAR